MPDYIPAFPYPGRVDFAKDQRTLRPLPPPGNDYDGTAFEDTTGHFEAQAQVTTVTLTGSTSENDVTTLTVVPTRTGRGSPWADEIPTLVATFTTGVTETLAAVATGLAAAVAASSQVISISDMSAYQRWSDFVTVTANGDNLVITTVDKGARFTVSISSTGSVTSSQVSENTDDDVLTVGTFAVKSGTNFRGLRSVTAPSSASIPAGVIGIIMDGTGTQPVSAGYAHKSYAQSADARARRWGRATVYCEGAASADGQVYARKTATGTEISGAASGTAVLDTPEVYTLTPTAVDSTLYGFLIEISNYFTGEVVASGNVSFTSGVGTNATLICDGLRTSLADDNDQLDDYVTGSGTATLILTMASPYVATISPYGPGVLAGYDTASTPAASDHMLIAGAKFLETTSAAGIQAVELPHP